MKLEYRKNCGIRIIVSEELLSTVNVISCTVYVILYGMVTDMMWYDMKCCDMMCYDVQTDNEIYEWM